MSEYIIYVTVLYICQNTSFCWKQLLRNKVESDEEQFSFEYLVTSDLL